MSVAVRPRVGFAGVGWIGRNRMKAVEPLVETAGICDPALEDALPDFDALLEEDLDAVVIATPSALHAEQAIAALERGLAVFCQKPLGRTAGETERVVAAARAADRLLAVDLSYRWAEAFRAVHELVRSGALGDVFAADLLFHNAYGPDKGWFYDPELSGGGCLIDLGIHLVDYALWTLDRDRFERVDGHVVGAPVEHYAEARLDEVRIACSWNLHFGRDCVLEAHFHGTEGGASVRNVDGSFYDFRAERYRGHDVEVLAEPPDDWGGRAIRDWAQRLAAGERFDRESERLVEVARTIDRIYRRR